MKPSGPVIHMLIFLLQGVWKSLAIPRKTKVRQMQAKLLFKRVKARQWQFQKISQIQRGILHG